ncbi:MAG TPA: exodeoxyribonuclease VII small subunit [Chlamydiales bacterium]|jgi:exodeoxyribonuclease VII small subunit
MTQETLSFEQAFERLEQILEKMNSGKTSLEDSLRLFEEAEGLTRLCSARLTTSEQRIESLLKQRGQVVVDAAGTPKTEPFGEPAPKTAWSAKSVIDGATVQKTEPSIQPSAILARDTNR